MSVAAGDEVMNSRTGLGEVSAGGLARVRKTFARQDPGFGPSGTQRHRYRTIWISDVHLGTRGCNDRMLIDFLDHVDSEYLYLVGDIIDGWRMKKRFYWPERHNGIVRRVMKRAKRGTQVIYVPGNHDEMFRQFAGMNFGGVEIRSKAVHTTADGRKLLVVHGDEYDAVVLAHRWLAFLGDWAYRTMMQLNVGVNVVRRSLGMEYWSLSKHAKHKVKSAVSVITRFEEALAHEAKLQGVDGVVCGHIHTAEIREFDGVTYYNDGDWVEGCTALVEHMDGRMEILHWPEEIKARNNASAGLQVAA
ncbi:MAG TPA: UDP-2,3-diacylglucosamine diphosphatase [Allosphingosinicella sp.]